MKLKELNEQACLDGLKQYTSSEYQLVWISGFWDAPMSGILKAGEHLYCFEMFDESATWQKGGWYRRYAIIELTTAQLQKELEVHRDFQRYVGTHWDVNPLEPPPPFIPNQSKVFYDTHTEYLHSQPFEENEVIGWFET